VTGASDEPRRELIPASPSALLNGLVVEYRGFLDEAKERPAQREPASASVPLVVDLGDGWHVATPAAGYRPQHLVGFAAGMHDTFALTEPAGPAFGVQVDLSPLGARRLFGLPMHELTNRVVPLHLVLGREAEVLKDRLQAARSWPDRFTIVDQALAGCLKDASAVSPGVERAWKSLECTGGKVSIARLGHELGWSRKRLVVRFLEEIGLTPKTAARVLRFQALGVRLRSGRARCWADLALECGYFDQSHLVREVRRLAGVTPTELLAGIGRQTWDAAVAV
jgi:AraC-like DNA-binding protein